MDQSRVSGILLHPTSLPGGHGIGDLGAAARRFIEFLAAAGQRRWQVLPLGPTGFGDSPYASFSSFAGNPLLVSPEQLVADGYLAPDELPAGPAGAPDQVDFGAVQAHRRALFGAVCARFRAAPPDGAREAFERFCKDEADWLDDYALFTALKERHGGAPWHAWEAPLRARDHAALANARVELAERVAAVCLEQFLFFGQWTALRRHAEANGVRIIGDLPIYVPHDSADAWTHPELFQLGPDGLPTEVAGVPPDYFSATGQLWGNPVYHWPAHARTGYAWWIARIRAQLRLVDVLRLDHFRGFAAYWEVPAGSATAIHGQWVAGPGAALFEALAEALGGGLPIIAEDLGIITPDVTALRESLGLPGMAVLQFAFDSDATNLHLPHHHQPNQVVYTGTHDNDTTVGWYTGLDDGRRRFADAYLAGGEGIHRTLIRAALGSVARTAIVPVQDVLGLDGRARMNHPGHAGGNWAWRLRDGQLETGAADWLLGLCRLYGRA